MCFPFSTWAREMNEPEEEILVWLLCLFLLLECDSRGENFQPPVPAPWLPSTKCRRQVGCTLSPQSLGKTAQHNRMKFYTLPFVFYIMHLLCSGSISSVSLMHVLYSDISLQKHRVDFTCVSYPIHDDGIGEVSWAFLLPFMLGFWIIWSL